MPEKDKEIKVDEGVKKEEKKEESKVDTISKKKPLTQKDKKELFL